VSTRAFSSLTATLLATLFVMPGCAGRGGQTTSTQATTQPPQASAPQVVEQPDSGGPLLADDASTMAGREVSGEGPLQKVHFDYDKALISAAAQTILDQNARYLQRNATTFVRIEGHADERGSVEYNQALGERRANAVKVYLVTAGIAANRMDTISFGEDRPIAFDHNEYAWAQNRRAEFRILSE
jgi:peptidoglycan-associated lipoprotein